MQCGSVVICRSSPSQKAAVVRMMMEYEMRQAEGRSKGLLKWYNRQMKKQVNNHGLAKKDPSYVPSTIVPKLCC